MIDILKKCVGQLSKITDRVIVGDDTTVNLLNKGAGEGYLCTAWTSGMYDTGSIGANKVTTLTFRVLKKSVYNNDITAELNSIEDCENVAVSVARALWCDKVEVVDIRYKPVVMLFDNQLSGIEVTLNASI